MSNHKHYYYGNKCYGSYYLGRCYIASPNGTGQSQIHTGPRLAILFA